jgi:uncharacterized membrane protein
MTTAVLRSPRERFIQTLWFEALGLAIVSPLFAWMSGASAGAAMGVLIVLAIVVMGWAALYNTLFDLAEHRCTRRVASDRTPGLRLVHAVGLELSAAIFTLPLVVMLTHLSWLEALVADIGLTLAYAAYGYCFHLGFDRLRPVAR